MQVHHPSHPRSYQDTIFQAELAGRKQREQDGGSDAAAINAILAEAFCVDLLTPLYEADRIQKAGILDVSFDLKERFIF